MSCSYFLQMSLGAEIFSGLSKNVPCSLNYKAKCRVPGRGGVTSNYLHNQFLATRHLSTKTVDMYSQAIIFLSVTMKIK